MAGRYGRNYRGNIYGTYSGLPQPDLTLKRSDRPPEVVSVKDEHCGNPCANAAQMACDKSEEKKPSIIDKLVSLVSPLFKKFFGREARLEDVIILGIIIVLLIERLKNGDNDKKTEKKEAFSLKNLTDNDILLVALLYIFL